MKRPVFRALFLVVLLPTLLLAAAFECGCCRSNETHVAWQEDDDEALIQQEVRNFRSLHTTQEDDCCDGCCSHQSRTEAERDALKYLRGNLMPFDESSVETLGFPDPSSDDADGLSNGLVGPSVTLALDAKRNYTWTDKLSKLMFYEYVLNFANANEARTNWRPLLLDRAVTHILEATLPETISDVVRDLNSHVWTALARKDGESIVFVSSQTPLIFDPMSVVAFGYASCTGLAVLFVDALRAAGVPARLAGTPAWLGNRTRGNHNWVEVYSNGEWYFVEPSPAQETIDTLERNPCERWFCTKDVFPGTPVYAARLDRQKAETHYPMAWEWNSTDVPGVNRTAYYTAICGQC